MAAKKKITEVRDAKQLSDLLKLKTAKYMVAVTVFDDSDKQLHSSAFTKDFPIGDMIQSVQDMAKCVKNVHDSEVRIMKQPKEVQSEHTANLIK